MKTFIEVADRGSFSRAAHSLRLGAASVSEHIGNLERHLGVPLFNRTTRSLNLTDEGLRYYRTAQTLLRQLDEVERELSGKPPAGLLRVEISDGIDEITLPALAAFQEHYPSIDLHIARSDHQFDTSMTGSDVMIRSVPPVHGQGLLTQAVGRSESIVAASPAYLERHGIPQAPNDLERHRCIGYLDPLSGRLWEWYFQTEGEPFTIQPPCPLAFTKGALRRRAAIAGIGIINDMHPNLADALREGLLVRLLQDFTMPAFYCHVVVPREQRKGSRASLFIDFMREWLENHIEFLNPSYSPGLLFERGFCVSLAPD